MKTDPGNPGDLDQVGQDYDEVRSQLGELVTLIETSIKGG